MATRSNTASRSSGARSSAPLPKGSRIPQPMLVVWCVRVLVLTAFVLFFAHQPLLVWANEPTRMIQHMGESGWLARLFISEGNQGDLLTALIRSILLWAVTPSLLIIAKLVSLVGLLIMLAELVLALFGMWQQQHVTPNVPTTYLLVRGQAPQVSQLSGVMRGANTPNGDEFYRAIQQSIPRGSWLQRLHGVAPWVTFTLTGIPDKPVEMGFIVADHNQARRVDTVMQIRAVIQGQSPGAQIEEVIDPLASELNPGRIVGWREFGLRLSPHYPLRYLDDIEGSDLLGPLVAVLSPHGTLRTEVQIVLRPADQWALNWGWRGYATALGLALQAKYDYALTEDAKTVEAKLDGAPFEVTLRIVALAEGPIAKAHLAATLNQISGTLGQYHQRTSHHLQTLVQIGHGQRAVSKQRVLLPLVTRAPRYAPLPDALLPIRLWRTPDILASIELGGFWHPPTSGLGQLVRWLNSKYIPAPAEAFTNGDPERLTLGHARHADGSIAPVGPTWRDVRQVLHITAGMGAGKTRLLANIIKQAIARGAFLLDGKGDDLQGSLAARVRAYIPLQDERRLIIFNILDTDWPIGLNPLAGINFSQPGAKTQALGQIMAIFSRLDPGWSSAPGMQEYVLNASLLVFDGQKHPTLAHIKQALLDEQYRTKLLDHCTNPEIRTYWTVEYPQHGEKQKTSLFALMRRFARLLTDETTRYLVSQPVPRLDLLKAIEEGKILLAPMPHQTLGTLAGAVGMLLLQAVLRAAMMRPGDDNSRKTYPLIIDELQVFIGEDEKNKDMETATSQLRGFGIAGIYAHQTISQLGQLENEMLTNSGSRVAMRTQEPDASTYAKMFAARGISAADISGQDPEEHQYADLLCNRRKTSIFSMITLGWPSVEEVTIPVYEGPDWKTLVPPDSSDHTFDQEVMHIIYNRPQNLDLVAAKLARQPDKEWERLLTRWAAIRDHQLQFILDNPGCIPERYERQTWISRLSYATPILLAEAEYARIRREIEPGENTGATAKRASGSDRHHSDANGAQSGRSAIHNSQEDGPEVRAHFGLHDVSRRNTNAASFMPEQRDDDPSTLGLK